MPAQVLYGKSNPALVIADRQTARRRIYGVGRSGRARDVFVQALTCECSLSHVDRRVEPRRTPQPANLTYPLVVLGFDPVGACVGNLESVV